MTKRKFLIGLAGLAVLALLVYQIPYVKTRLDWRIEIAKTYLRGMVQPAGPVPTARPVTLEPPHPTLTATRLPSPEAPPILMPTATSTPAPLPASVSLESPTYELQSINNCGPATLAMALRYFGWAGNQSDISEIIKPIPEDRNVNPEEMAYWVRNFAGWLRAEYRVNGNLTLLKRLLAAGFPVIIEEVFTFDDPFWPNDDLWAAHYLLLTGYDDPSRTFTVQDSFHGANLTIGYEKLDANWEPFNRVYMLAYLPEQESRLKDILGADWDPDGNRLNALAASEAATGSHPENAFAWFNLGTNLVALERYTEAAQAYDSARQIGLPQRMLRYQFGPFLAYFHAFRTEDLLTLADYALQRTPNSEEALLWKGWGLYRQGDANGAIQFWQKALEERPGYPDAQYALDFVR
jgi:tetratricopeptide (TPR) repeat protein